MNCINCGSKRFSFSEKKQEWICKNPSCGHDSFTNDQVLKANRKY